MCGTPQCPTEFHSRHQSYGNWPSPKSNYVGEVGFVASGQSARRTWLIDRPQGESRCCAGGYYCCQDDWWGWRGPTCVELWQFASLPCSNFHHHYTKGPVQNMSCGLLRCVIDDLIEVVNTANSTINRVIRPISVFGTMSEEFFPYLYFTRKKSGSKKNNKLIK